MKRTWKDWIILQWKFSTLYYHQTRKVLTSYYKQQVYETLL
jgi:hypothetical protein